jgi:hypothetical protein
MLEAENWKIAVSLYKDRPIPALLLAHQLTAIKQCLQRGSKDIPEAIEALTLTIESLYPHSSFDRVRAANSFGVYSKEKSPLSRKNYCVS